MKITANEIERAKVLAELNYKESMEKDSADMTGFEFNGIHIINPWMDETGRFELTDAKAIEYYGLENVLNFIINILKEGS